MRLQQYEEQALLLVIWYPTKRAGRVCYKEFQKHEDNPFNSLTLNYNSTIEDKRSALLKEKEEREERSVFRRRKRLRCSWLPQIPGGMTMAAWKRKEITKRRILYPGTRS
jgi:hypothetical protein